MKNFEPRNYRLDNVELNWAKLVKPVNPFGQEQYELQIATSDKAVADEWAANHLNVKSKDGKFTVSLKRKARKADGSDNGAPRVVSADATPFANADTIGNGSTGNVIVYQRYYETAGRSGISNSLTAVQVVKLEAYSGSADFEPVSVAATDDQPPFETAEATDKAPANPF